MLSRALDTHSLLEKAQDVEWIHIVLSFLKTYVEHRNSEILLHEADKIGYVANLINSLKTSAERLETGLDHFLFLVSPCSLSLLQIWPILIILL